MFKGTIFFDLGNVLLFFSHEKMYRNLASLSLLEPEEIQDSFSQFQLLLYEKGKIHTLELYELFLKKSKKPISFKEWIVAVSDIFTPNKEVIDILKQLKNNKLQIILISNTSPLHFAYAKASFPFLSLFDRYVLSYEVGCSKPEEEIFHHALSHVKDTQPTFYTDDVPAFVEAALRCGIDAEVYLSPNLLKEQLMSRGFLA